MCEVDNNLRLRKDLLNYLMLSLCNDAVSDAIFLAFAVMDRYVDLLLNPIFCLFLACDI